MLLFDSCALSQLVLGVTYRGSVLQPELNSEETVSIYRANQNSLYKLREHVWETITITKVPINMQ